MADWLDYCKKWEEKIGAFIEFAPDKATVGNGEFAGLPFAVKDNIAVKDFSLSCGSKFLQGMSSPYTATAVQKLVDAGARVVGKTNMDEFGMGSSTDLSAIKKTNNPWDISRVAGGSSGGSAAAVAAGLVPFALGSDTGGSVRQPAAFCGVVGLKPTWGAVSRFGLVAYASSLETIGVFSDGVERCRAVFKCIAGQDLRDQNSENAPSSAGVAEKTIGVLSPDAIAKALDGKTVIEPAVERGFITAQEKLKALGYKLVPVEIPSLKYAVPAYYTIASAEASANLARFDGVRYGRRPEWAENPESLVKNARTEGFGAEVKLRVLLGTFVLRSGFQDQYYNKAQKIRSLIRLDFEKELNGCSAILMPVFPTLAFARGGKGLSSFEQKVADVYTCCANLAGLPALSFPASVEDGLPAGVQLLGKRFSENTLFDVALDYEKSSPFPHPEGWEQFWQSGAK